MDRRITIFFWVLSLIGSLTTASATLYVRTEIMEMRLLLIERITEAGRDYATRHEYDSLSSRVSQLEQRSRTTP